MTVVAKLAGMVPEVYCQVKSGSSVLGAASVPLEALVLARTTTNSGATMAPDGEAPDAAAAAQASGAATPTYDKWVPLLDDDGKQLGEVRIAAVFVPPANVVALSARPQAAQDGNAAAAAATSSLVASSDKREQAAVKELLTRAQGASDSGMLTLGSGSSSDASVNTLGVASGFARATGPASMARPGRVVVTLYRGKELKNKQWFGKQDPFVLLRAESGGDAKSRAGDDGGWLKGPVAEDGDTEPDWNAQQLVTILSSSTASLTN